MYVLRDENGLIYAVFANPQDFATEYLDPTNAELVAWMDEHSSKKVV